MTVRYGSDLVIETLGQLGITRAVINPGASLSGVHDSLARSSSIESLLALHENVAVAMGDGYARVAERPMAVLLHNLVGLQSGSMGIFNAWVNQVPMLVLGGAGPTDWAARRPWIDWVHSGKPQSLAIRDAVKWHDQPASLEAIVPSITRGLRMATQAPAGPTYVALDVQLQEAELSAAAAGPTAEARTTVMLPPQRVIDEVAVALAGAEFPVVVADVIGGSEGFEGISTLAEALGAAVVDLGGRHNLPPRHWADCTFARSDVLARADVVLALGVRDLNYAIGQVQHRDIPWVRLVPESAQVIDVGTRSLMSGALVDYASPEGDAWSITAEPAGFLSALGAQLQADVIPAAAPRKERVAAMAAAARPDLAALLGAPPKPDGVSLLDVSVATWNVLKGSPVVVANGDLRGWLRAVWDLPESTSYLGRNLGAGLGYGIGASIGAAVALKEKGSGEIVVNFQNDGDLLYTATGLWTAARYELPLLNIVVNNRMYGQDKRHADRLSSLRGHPAEFVPEGLEISGPDIDFAALGQSQGMRSWGPARSRTELELAVAQAVAHIRSTGTPALVDAHVTREEQRLVAL